MKKLIVVLALLTALLAIAASSWFELSKLDLTQGPKRAAWQRPEQVVAALGLRPGSRVADIGAGEGYFTLLLAEAVGPSGRVYAVDVDSTTLAKLQRTVDVSSYDNIDVIHGELDDPRLPDRSIDVAFLCNTYHHLEGRTAYFSGLKNDLKPGGRVAVVDIRDDVAGVASLFVDADHWIRWEDLYGEMSIAGYDLKDRFGFLPVQHFAIFAPDAP
ncbi:MAG: methyltransferase domain-containing protein [Acidobacteriota bacterium]